ncbi:unnamed protein product [Urochloa humidicola]
MRLQAPDPAWSGPVRDRLLPNLGRRLRSAAPGPSAMQGCGGQRGRRDGIWCGVGLFTAAGAQIREHGGDAPNTGAGAAEARQPATDPARGGGGWTGDGRGSWPAQAATRVASPWPGGGWQRVARALTILYRRGLVATR